MRNEIVNKHDATFKEVFSQKWIAKEFIENNIPNGKGAITMSILQKREEIGRQEGMREGLEHVAKNLLEEGMEIALVIKTTGLSRSQVEKLKKN